MKEEKKRDKNQHFTKTAILRNIYKNVDRKYPDWSRQRKYATTGSIYAGMEK